MIDVTSLAVAAARLAADGFRLVPLRAAGKIPMIDDWPNRATTDPSIVAAWWSRWPEANIGIATGAGLLVVDVDEGGEATLQALEQQLGSLPRTRTVRTGGGGQHLYLRLPDGVVVGNSVRQLGAGVDIRADGGQVVAPPSLHKTGRRYEYVTDAPIADIPAAWLAHILSARAERERGPVQLEDGELLGEGGRNDTLFRLGSAMRAKGFDAEAILAALLATNDRRCRPALPLAEVEQITNSICRYAAGDVGGVITHGEHGVAPTAAVAPPHGALSFGKLASDVEPEPVEWLWQNWLPLGMFTLLDGNPGVGKSFLLLDLAARVSTGRPCPTSVGGDDAAGGDEAKARGVILLMPEDDNAKTIVPRLIEAGADRRRIILESKMGDLTSSANVAALEDAIRRVDAALICVDPLLTYLGGEKTDVHKDRDVRRALDPLIALAARHNICVLGNRHLNKGGKDSGPALYRGMGSIGITGVARVAWLAAKDPENADKAVLAQSKNNLAKTAASLRYAIEAGHGPDRKIGRIGWHGESNMTADLLTVTADPDETSKFEEACNIIRRCLDNSTLAPGGALSAEIYAELKEAGITGAGTILKARRALKVDTERSYSGGTRWYYAATPDLRRVSEGVSEALARGGIGSE